MESGSFDGEDDDEHSSVDVVVINKRMATKDFFRLDGVALFERGVRWK